MNLNRKIHVVWTLCLCLLLGCGQNDSSGENIVPGMIRDLSIKQSEDHVELYGDVAKVCTQIDVADDAVSKSSQYDELAKRLVSFDFTNLASGDRVLIFGDYWRSLALVCAKMADEGSLTPKSFAVLLNGWKKCRDMCNLPTSDNTPDAAVESQVRGDVRTLRCLFENDAALFERDVLRLMLKNHDGPSAIAVKTSDADSDFPRRKIHDLELEVLEVA